MKPVIPAIPPATPKVALITGAAARIGAALAESLHAEGYRIALHYHRSQASAAALAERLNKARPDSVVLLQADLLDNAAVIRLAAEALEQWGRLDVLINNASAFYRTPLASVQEADWDALMHSNAKAPLFLCRELQPALQASRGSILNLVDSTAMLGLREFTPYAMAKAALASMTRSLASELAPHIRVNGISPGIILWPDDERCPSEQEQQLAISQTALKRVGAPADICAAASFLIHQATYLTGEIIQVDGGATLAF